ncbi:unnamed protein product [Vitrella brassicaformis CCMP3155]|uniref:FAS1 domain-containing protein n=1 Tax=Vitrella brassicaformis (strain CCMP3155) TaxID=1169540 RepID=A0A0G4GZP0_VITBC|nr:unnamed protein product [Vitrella brassicaformis CCMP3155]|eukprot:CEM36638.1 unnamed protein product [Vitrella brassicaformis CCMP3155]
MVKAATVIVLLAFIALAAASGTKNMRYSDSSYYSKDSYVPVDSYGKTSSTYSTYDHGHSSSYGHGYAAPSGGKKGTYAPPTTGKKDVPTSPPTKKDYTPPTKESTMKPPPSGGKKGSTTPTPTPPAAPTPSPTPMAEPATPVEETPPSVTIADLAASEPRLSTLLAAVEAAGLMEDLRGPGPITLFAPTNEAFAAIPNFQEISADTEILSQILKYHVIPARLTSSDLTAQLAEAEVIETRTALGAEETVTVTGEDGDILINGNVRVVQPDITASNGIVHIVDSVLIPQLPAQLPEVETAAPPEAEELPALLDVAQATPELSSLVTAVEAADFSELLSQDGPFTVFAPTNEAFTGLGETYNALLEPQAEDDLKTVLAYHVVGGTFTAADVIELAADGPATLTTLQGSPLTVQVVDGEVFVNRAKVIQADVQASNAVVHIVNGVLIPPPDGEQESATAPPSEAE